MKIALYTYLILAGLELGHLKGFAQIQQPTENGFKIKGFHLDLRIQVMRMPVLKQFALKLSKNGINTLVMEWEASYPYEKHTVISGSHAYSRAEIKSFIAYCDTLNIDVIPLQQSFGHVEYILKHYRYRAIREDEKDYSQVNPIREEECKALFTDLYKDLIKTHHSKYVHIGGDETYLLGHGEESKKKVAAVGKGRLYGDYIKMICELVVGLGKTPVLWADIALHYPEALKGLPKQTIFVDWNYGWDLNRFGDHDQLVKSGFEIWGSPAIRSANDNYFLVDWNKHLENIRSFIPQAKQLGYKGIVMTSWSTSGIYNNIFESGSDLVGMHAIRRVYPISGFNLLIDGYFKALNTDQPLNVDSLVTQYSQEKYGFNKAQSRLFWNALKRTPAEVNQGKVSQPNLTIANLLDSALQSAKELKSLKPSWNKKEYKHYVLLSDIRIYYLVCIKIENEMNASNYTINQIKSLRQELQVLRPEKLDKRFSKLNKHLLFQDEIALENNLRNMRFKQLKAKLGYKN
ncbi:beta-N-acetylhexosaminidase [Desertivirga xinjiangensis]|uniref:beta-N-acetylhexosaminidase n=1 Tax=Desertivirga xinjiangensis TaxID=539206 RepID=UPI00210AB935|nr:beta-N-acetylhexosaminidase [Pedobacter xinjiangensis]